MDALEVVGFSVTRCGRASWLIEDYLSGCGFACCITIFIIKREPHRKLLPFGSKETRTQRARQRYLDLLAVCLGNILTIVDSDLLVLGGGLSNFSAIAEDLRAVAAPFITGSPRAAHRTRATRRCRGMRGAAFLHVTINVRVDMQSRRID
ncbi:ROK family protein [Shigella flexneri]